MTYILCNTWTNRQRNWRPCWRKLHCDWNMHCKGFIDALTYVFWFVLTDNLMGGYQSALNGLRHGRFFVVIGRRTSMPAKCNWWNNGILIIFIFQVVLYHQIYVIMLPVYIYQKDGTFVYKTGLFHPFMSHEGGAENKKKFSFLSGQVIVLFLLTDNRPEQNLRSFALH